MKKAFVFGISGKMGKMLSECAADCGFEITGGFDIVKSQSVPTFDDIRNVNVPFDVIIDFSRPFSLSAIVALVEKNPVPVVIATTGYNDSELKTISMMSQKVPVMHSGNFSLGIAAVKAAAKAAQAVLGDMFDIEIVEKHHNRKVDSPSGTALMLADALAPRDSQVVDRMGKRNKGELGITSVRGGGVVGEHEIGFYGEDEIVTISHSARSRKLFAAGAFKAAHYLLTQKPGMYDMDDIIG